MEIPDNFLIYGSTGYTGRLVVAEALRRGLKPVLAGRNVEKVGRQASAAGLEWRAFRLKDERALDRALKDTGMVLLLAGPFYRTAWRVVQACMRTGAHYLDINGELDIYEGLAGCSSQARARGVMLATGLGFDVVPSDCLAAYLKGRLPTASELRLAFTWQGPAHMSHGTIRSGLEELRHGTRVRRKGQLVLTEAHSKSIVIDFGHGPTSCDLVSWGDVVTAWYSTAIPNIEVYTPSRFSQQRQMALVTRSQRFLGWSVTRGLAHRLIRFFPNGSTSAERKQTSTVVWGQARDPSGWKVSALIQTMDPYELTARTTVRAMQRILAGEGKPGFQTPSLLFGADFIMDIDGVKRDDLEV